MRNYNMVVNVLTIGTKMMQRITVTVNIMKAPMMMYWWSICSSKKNPMNVNTALMAAVQYTDPAMMFESFSSLIFTF